MQQYEVKWTHSDMFPTTAVTFKTAPTSMKAKKQKPDSELGVAPPQSSMVKIENLSPPLSHNTFHTSSVATASMVPL